jgi:hypothetical protein
VTGAIDRSNHRVRLEFEFVHLLALVVAVLVAAVGYLPRLRAVQGDPVRRRVVR